MLQSITRDSDLSLGSCPYTKVVPNAVHLARRNRFDLTHASGPGGPGELVSYPSGNRIEMKLSTRVATRQPDLA